MQVWHADIDPESNQLEVHATGDAKMLHLIHDAIHPVKSSHHHKPISSSWQDTYSDIYLDHHDLIPYRTNMYDDIIFIGDHTQVIARPTYLIDNILREIPLTAAKPCFMTLLQSGQSVLPKT